eukprot:3420709-Amphidinium_carterae.1
MHKQLQVVGDFVDKDALLQKKQHLPPILLLDPAVPVICLSEVVGVNVVVVEGKRNKIYLTKPAIQGFGKSQDHRHASYSWIVLRRCTGKVFEQT